jgi:hypothetical protein
MQRNGVMRETAINQAIKRTKAFQNLSGHFCLKPHGVQGVPSSNLGVPTSKGEHVVRRTTLMDTTNR